MSLIDNEIGRPFAAKGHWWLPQSPAGRKAGVITCTASGRLELDLFENLGQEFDQQTTIPAIYGVLSTGEKCVLLSASAMSLVLDPYDDATYSGRRLLVDRHLDDPSRLQLGSIFLELTEMEDWSGIVTFNTPHGALYSLGLGTPKVEVTHGYKTVFECSFLSTYKFQLTSSVITHHDRGKAIELFHRFSVIIEPAHPDDLDRIENLILCFRRFFSLMMNRHVSSPNPNCRSGGG